MNSANSVSSSRASSGREWMNEATAASALLYVRSETGLGAEKALAGR